MSQQATGSAAGRPDGWRSQLDWVRINPHPSTAVSDVLHRRSKPQACWGEVRSLDEPALSVSFLRWAEERRISDRFDEGGTGVGCIRLESDEITDGREAVRLAPPQRFIHESHRVTAA